MRPGDFDRIFGALNEARVRYLVVGGLAAVLHGVPRATFDVDICLEMSQENLGRFWETMAEMGYRPRLPVSLPDLADPAKLDEWREEKNLKAITFWHPGQNLALALYLVLDSPLDFAAAYERKVTFPYHRTFLTTVAKTDLVALKKEAGRFKDLEDIKALADD